MKRRDFIRKGLMAGNLALMPGLLRSLPAPPFQGADRKRLVVIQLVGGNDGLNTVVPYRDDNYYRMRPDIAIRSSRVLKATDELGINPEMAGVRELYDRSYLTVVNNVGYPGPDRSHFRSTDIWQTASDSDEYLDTGWLGRCIEHAGKMPYTGIEVDDSLSLVMKGAEISGIATRDPRVLFRNARTPYFRSVLEYAGEMQPADNPNLAHIYRTMALAGASARYIHKVTEGYESSADYPQDPFGRQLKAAATFINSGLDTSVYFISLGGFDTHANQMNRQNKLLGIYSNALKVFVDDLDRHGTFRDTLIFTFSEFGRRVKQNAARGTDHGTANNVFVVGKDLKAPGIYNEGPDLADLDENGDLKHSIDFRSVYATLLGNWLGVNDESVLNRPFRKLSFI